MRREIGSALIWQWKINKSLYEAYGGHIISPSFRLGRERHRIDQARQSKLGLELP